MSARQHSVCVLTVLAFLCSSGHAADTVAFWTFDDGSPTNMASTLVSETNTPTLNATATRYGSGAIPTFSADRPGVRVYGGIAGHLARSTNSASLRFINSGVPTSSNSYDGGSAYVADNERLLRASNITVEAFIKVDRHVNWPLVIGKVRGDNGASWNLSLNNAGTLVQDSVLK